MKRITVFIFDILLLAPCVFPAIPIQGTSLMGVSPAEARSRVIAAAESYLGTPYRYAGIDRGGMDCSGLVYASFRDALRYASPRTADAIYGWTERIETSELQPGDLVFFITVGARVSHVGIYVGGGSFIHSASEGPSTGVIYSRLDEAYWRRTYTGAGRALPWDSVAALAFAQRNGAGGGSTGAASATQTTGNTGQPQGNTAQQQKTASYNRNSAGAWADPGLFIGTGAAWTWGGFFEGAPSSFRGFAMQAAAGYKWTKYRVGIELRPEWDRALGVTRLPLTLSFGTDSFQIFAGPALTIGNPRLNTSEGERNYKRNGNWPGELGISSSFPFIQLRQGAFSLYGEMAWRAYSSQDESYRFKPDLTANLRISTGVRYLWKL